jgi:glutaconate CoA-transferase subunit B
MAVIRYRSASREPYLSSYHPGLSAERVQAETGFELDVADAVQTPPPTADELEILRHAVDPEGIFLRNPMDGLRSPRQGTLNS